MRTIIEQTARAAGISQIGFLDAEVYSDLGTVLGRHGSVPMAEQDTQKRINPFLIMEEAQSIIACLFSYYRGNIKGNISKYARCADYHTVVGSKLDILCELLRSHGYKAERFCDSGALNDRYIAVRAGLGFVGKNGFLINERFGTYTFIGYIITSCKIEQSGYELKSCAECGRCIRACPSGALTENGVDGYKCLSYITQKKGELDEDEQQLVRRCGTAWGCDICQDVCPHNKCAEHTDIDEFVDDAIDILEIDENISNKEFKRIYGARAFAWRGKKPLIRNLKLISD